MFPRIYLSGLLLLHYVFYKTQLRGRLTEYVLGVMS